MNGKQTNYLIATVLETNQILYYFEQGLEGTKGYYNDTILNEPPAVPIMYSYSNNPLSHTVTSVRKNPKARAARAGMGMGQS